MGRISANCDLILLETALNIPGRCAPSSVHSTHIVGVEAGTCITVVLGQLSPRAVHYGYAPELPPAAPELSEGHLGALVFVFRLSRDRRGSGTQKARVVGESLCSGTWVQQPHDSQNLEDEASRPEEEAGREKLVSIEAARR